jgi:hypothetical protein
MRSMAQKRLTAVGRVFAHQVAEVVEVLFEVGDRSADGLHRAEREPHRGRDADGGRAAHDHRLDGLGDLLARAQHEVLLFVGRRRWSIMRTPSSVHSTVLIMAGNFLLEVSRPTRVLGMK